MTPDVADLQARVAYLSDELARAKMALASPGCGEACPVATKLRALLASCDERLDELGCGACYVPPTASVDAVPEAVGEAMTTLRKALARLRVERERLVEAAVRATIEACAEVVRSSSADYYADRVADLDPAPIVARVLGGGNE